MLLDTGRTLIHFQPAQRAEKIPENRRIPPRPALAGTAKAHAPARRARRPRMGRESGRPRRPALTPPSGTFRPRRRAARAGGPRHPARRQRPLAPAGRRAGRGWSGPLLFDCLSDYWITLIFSPALPLEAPYEALWSSGRRAGPARARPRLRRGPEAAGVGAHWGGGGGHLALDREL